MSRSGIAGCAFILDAFLLYWLVFVVVLPWLTGWLSTVPWSMSPVGA